VVLSGALGLLLARWKLTYDEVHIVTFAGVADTEALVAHVLDALVEDATVAWCGEELDHDEVAVANLRVSLLSGLLLDAYVPDVSLG
jgi:hypothetical protein